jgi:MFS family permease
LGRAFGLLWGASGASNLADGILHVGAPLLAVTLTRSPFLVSLVTAAVWLPWLLFALHAGAIADRNDRRKIMLAASLSRAGVLAAVVVLTATAGLNLPVLYAAVFLVGVAEVFSDTSAQSMLPMIVSKARLGDANGRLVAAQTVANDFLGAPLAGVLVGIAAATVFGAAGLGYALAGILLLRIKGRFRVQTASTESLRSDIAAGLRLLWEHRLLRGLALAAGLLNLATNAYMAVFVLWTVGPESAVGLSAVGYGVFAAAAGVGAVIGSLLVARVTMRVGQSQTLIASLLILSGVLVVPVILPVPGAVLAVGFVIGVCVAAASVIVVSMRQRLVAEEFLGRVNASYRLIGVGGVPIGAIGGGALGTLAGLPAVFYAAIALCLSAVVFAATQVSPRSLAAAEREARERAS